MSRVCVRPSLEAGSIFKPFMLWLFAAAWPLFSAAQNLQISLPDYTVCEGGSVTLVPQVSGGTPPYTYTWSPAAGLSCDACATPVASPAQTTTYQLTVLDNAGLGNTAVTIVNVVASLSAAVSPSFQQICEGGMATLFVSTTPGTGTCSIVWEQSPNGTDMWTTVPDAIGSIISLSTLAPGIHFFRVRFTCPESGCDTAFSNVVEVFVLDTPAPMVSVTPVSSATCAGQGVTLTVDISGTSGNCTIQWQRASPWTDIPGATGPTYTHNATATGTYFYRAVLICSDGDCGNTFISNQVPVMVLGSPAVQIAPAERTVCVGGTARFTATTNGANLLSCNLNWFSSPNPDGPWEPVAGATGNTFLAPTSTEGTMYYIAAPWCYNGACPQPASNVVSVMVTDHVTPSITLTPISPLCDGDQGSIQVLVTGTGDNFFITSLDGSHSAQGPPGVTITLAPFPPGTYCFLVSGNNGCAPTEICTTIGQQPPPLSISPSITPPSCASVSDGSISILVSGGMPPYTYAWGNGATTASLSNVSPGIYTLTVTDANGCTDIQTLLIEAELGADAGPWQTLDCITTEVTLSGSVSISGPGISYTWFAPDGSLIGSQPEVVVGDGGLYRFRATNTSVNDCFSEALVLVTDLRDFIPQAIEATLTACNTWLLRPEIQPGYNGPMDLEWTFPDGTISTAEEINPTQTGVYQLRASIPGSGCESVLSQFISVDADECATISGRVVFDVDENCQADTGEAGLAGWIIRATGSAGAFHALTDTAGTYAFSLPLGNYILSAIPPSASWMLCNPSNVVALTVAGQMGILDIPAQFVVLCPELEVQLTTPFLRRCFPSSYYLRVCNTGTESVQAPEVSLLLDDFLEFLGSEYTPQSIDGQTIHWTLSPLGPGECLQFRVSVRVSCEAALGQTHCSIVTTTPDSICVPASSLWSGASLEITGECTGEDALFRVRNAGAGDLNESVQFIVIEDVVMLMQMPNTIDNLSSGEALEFELPANGSTWFFSVEQAPFHPLSSVVTAALEGCGTDAGGAFSTGFINQLPLQTPTPASFILCVPNIGAYDPNDKQAIPVGYGTQHFIHAGDPLSYKIRFQNTGTDTAFTVIIRDTLSPWLDITTLRPGPSSHEYRLDITGERTLVFTFDNILLPDSTTNLEASQGFVDFFIQTADSIPLLTRIENSAGIYFDFNEPIITNTVFHTIGRDFFEQVSATFYPPALRPQWRVFPNPTSDEAMLVLEEAAAGVKTAWLYDAFGRQVLRLPFEGDRCLLQLTGMAPGWYALRVTDAAGRSLGAGRVVLR